MKTNFAVECHFPVSTKIIYEAWLSSQEHEQMTGGGAECSDSVGGFFSAWDGYISGKNLSLNPGNKLCRVGGPLNSLKKMKTPLLPLN